MKTIIKYAFLFLFIIIQSASSAQIESETPSYLEVQGVIGLVNLIRVSDGIDSSFPGFESESVIRNDLTFKNFSGFHFQAGVLGLRSLGQSFWLRSGIQYNYLKGKGEYLSENWFLIPPNDQINSFNWIHDVSFQGFQVPVQLEYQFKLKNVSPYFNLGLALGYSKARINYNYEESTFYSFGIGYNEDCGWCEIINLNQIDPPFHQNNKGSFKQDQYQFIGLLGLGTFINSSKNGRWRIGYQLSADLIELNEGNNAYNNVYESFFINGAEFHHLSHQFELAYLIGSKQKTENNTPGNNALWNGIFTGLGVDVQIGLSNKDRSGRSGIGWGSTLNLMYISSIGLGARVVRARWIAPSSDYGTISRIYKTEAIYQFPSGIQFHSGLIRRTDGDSDGGGGGGWGFLAGAGTLILVHPFVGIHLQLTGQYFKPSEEKFLLEIGVGAVYRIWN